MFFKRRNKTDVMDEVRRTMQELRDLRSRVQHLTREMGSPAVR
jgi:hypothetical protein